MARGFENKDTAKKAGQKSKRGSDKTPYELKQALAEGLKDRLPKLWIELDKLDKTAYLNYITKLLQIVTPKDLDIKSGGETIDIFKSMTTEELERRAEAMNKLKNE